MRLISDKGRTIESSFVYLFHFLFSFVEDKQNISLLVQYFTFKIFYSFLRFLWQATFFTQTGFRLLYYLYLYFLLPIFSWLAYENRLLFLSFHSLRELEIVGILLFSHARTFDRKYSDDFRTIFFSVYILYDDSVATLLIFFIFLSNLETFTSRLFFSRILLTSFSYIFAFVFPIVSLSSSIYSSSFLYFSNFFPPSSFPFSISFFLFLSLFPSLPHTQHITPHRIARHCVVSPRLTAAISPVRGVIECSCNSR
jgi:hypothetical protein